MLSLKAPCLERLCLDLYSAIAVLKFVVFFNTRPYIFILQWAPEIM